MNLSHVAGSPYLALVGPRAVMRKVRRNWVVASIAGIKSATGRLLNLPRHLDPSLLKRSIELLASHMDTILSHKNRVMQRLQQS